MVEMKKKVVSYTARSVTFLLQANRRSPLACPHTTLYRHFSEESCHHECTSPLCTIVTQSFMPGINTGPDIAPALLCGHQGSGIVYSFTSLSLCPSLSPPPRELPPSFLPFPSPFFPLPSYPSPLIIARIYF